MKDNFRFLERKNGQEYLKSLTTPKIKNLKSKIGEGNPSG